MDSAGQLLEPWHAESAPEFAAEMQRELVSGHVLFGAQVMAVARRQDGDDVLFAIRDGTERMAEVHLTWLASGDRSPLAAYRAVSEHGGLDGIDAVRPR